MTLVKVPGIVFDNGTRKYRGRTIEVRFTASAEGETLTIAEENGTGKVISVPFDKIEEIVKYERSKQL